MYPDTSCGLNKETETEIYFFTPAFEVLNNFSAHNIEIWGELFPTAEHAFQWKKFTVTGPELAESIQLAGSPYAVKQISDANKNLIPDDWSETRVKVMEEILKAKLTQHSDVLERLKFSAEKKIIENSPVDSFWGNGPDGKGENTLGQLWMKLRSELQN